MVCCPHCQHESAERFFCERCNHLLPVTFQSPVPDSVRLPDGRVIDCSAYHGVWPADAWTARAGVCAGRPCRVYAINRTWWRQWSAVVHHRASVALDVLAPVAVVPVGQAAVVVAGAWPEARASLLDLDPPGTDVFGRLDSALAACRLLERALTPLHASGFVWVGFSPAGLDVAPGGVMIRSLDLQLFAAGARPLDARTTPAYSAPELSGLGGEEIGPATDVFHVSLYAYYRLAGLLPGGFPGDGPEAFDYALPELRIYRPDLPPGIARVLDWGLTREPSARWPSVKDLCDEFETAVERARRRQSSSAPVRIDAAGGSHVGSAHERMGLPNQDAFGLASLEPGVLLAIVADGVSQAKIGSGDRASRIALRHLASGLPELLRRNAPGGSIRDLLRDAFLHTSSAILADIQAELPPAGSFSPLDIMSSTALVGLLQGNELILASVGDSRAYLVADGVAEQLTVDGDLRCYELSAGAPPEQIARLGVDGSALYSCLGAGEFDAEGKLVTSEDRSLPHFTRWKLLPGDVVVLCTDGLAEEGVFLGAADLARIAAGERGLAASELVERLISAARDCAQPPSLLDPYGWGDDITCVVLAVE